MTDADRQHASRVARWLTDATLAKYEAGVAHHGGHLPNKGGLLHEAECEVLDQAVYIFTLREQLQRVEKWIEDGNTENALIAIGHILRGTPLDRFPEG